MTTGERVLTVGQRRDTVEGETDRAAPHDDVTALQPDAARAILTARAAEQKHRGKPE